MIPKVIKRKQELVLIILLIPLTLIIQKFILGLLPDKYFYDSYGILNLVNNPSLEKYYDNSYSFIGRIFRRINVFGFTEFMQWSYTISFIAIIITLAKLSKYKKINIDIMVFIYLTIILQNIYIYRISKDIVQTVFFTIIDLIIVSSISKYKIKVLGVIGVLLIEANVFRYYYYITAGFFIFVYLLLKNIKRVNVIKVIAIFLICLTIVLIVLQKVDSAKYNDLIYIRVKMNRNRQESSDAITQINDVIKNNGNVGIYMINYFINLLRCLLPIELMTKGIKYIPFILYQIYISVFLIKKLSYIRNNEIETEQIILISMFIAYLLVATLHEPDFGSLIRHESTLAFILFDILLYKNKEKKKVDNENHKESRC